MNTTLQTLTVFLLLFVLGGCASKYYQVTPEVYRERVKVLGVLPIMVDAESTILHPQRQVIIDLLQQSARDKYLRLSEQLGASAGYSAVRPVIIDVPSQWQLIAGKTLQSGKDGTCRRYQPASDAVSALARSAGVDGLLVVILNGVENKGKRSERLGPRYLEASFNEIQATAMVLGATGEILWEKSGASGAPFVDLQYVDFDEALHNKTDEVVVRFITPDGLSRALQASDKEGLFDKEVFPTLYRRLFDSLSEGLAVGQLWRK
jgi:hypothetical protein